MNNLQQISIKDLVDNIKNGVQPHQRELATSTASDKTPGAPNQGVSDTHMDEIVPGLADDSSLTCSQIGNMEEFISSVKTWNMEGENYKLMEVDMNIVNFFGNVKSVTNVPAKKFINYILAYFLACNPGFEKYILGKVRANGPSKFFKNIL